MLDEIRRHLNLTYTTSEFHAPTYRGKVRDVYRRGDELLIVATDRVSVFDQVVGTIPFKGSLLTEQSTFWLKKAQEVIKTHLVSREDPQIQRCHAAQPFLFEIVVRGYLAGSLLREPAQTRGNGYGLTLNPLMKAYEAFDQPIITPSTKANAGSHDEPISPGEIISHGLATKAQLDFIFETSYALYALGTHFAQSMGLILADTKYEFGICNGKVILIDEIHTADSSRYWILNTAQERIKQGLDPEMLDKERLRKTLLSQGVDPKGTVPIAPLTDNMRIDLAGHYWDLTQTLTGERFLPSEIPSSIRVPLFLEKWKALF